MKECYKLLEGSPEREPLHVDLDFQQRQKSRHRARTRCGESFAWFLERGRVLQQGDLLQCEDGTVIEVTAADESVSEVFSSDQHLLMRAAYHLGNRHVPLQIETGFLRYQHDHVLDAMLRGLGLDVKVCEGPFHPENGAYSGGHSHAHSHTGSHSH